MTTQIFSEFRLEIYDSKFLEAGCSHHFVRSFVHGSPVFAGSLGDNLSLQKPLRINSGWLNLKREPENKVIFPSEKFSFCGVIPRSLYLEAKALIDSWNILKTLSIERICIWLLGNPKKRKMENFEFLRMELRRRRRVRAEEVALVVRALVAMEAAREGLPPAPPLPRPLAAVAPAAPPDLAGLRAWLVLRDFDRAAEDIWVVQNPPAATGLWGVLRDCLQYFLDSIRIWWNGN